MRRKFAFLVNFWFEPEGPESSAGSWRGSVEHLASGRRLYFNEIASLIGFFSSWIGKRGAE
jgi:hypothetical protein